MGQDLQSLSHHPPTRLIPLPTLPLLSGTLSIWVWVPRMLQALVFCQSPDRSGGYEAVSRVLEDLPAAYQEVSGGPRATVY